MVFIVLFARSRHGYSQVIVIKKVIHILFSREMHDSQGFAEKWPSAIQVGTSNMNKLLSVVVYFAQIANIFLWI